jgi:hypothetical protein
MSIWSQYEALADYITLKYQSELRTVLGTATLLIEEESETRSLYSESGRGQERRDFYRVLLGILTAARAAPATSTYEVSAHSIRLTPRSIRKATTHRHHPHGLPRLVWGPPKRSIFSQKATLREWQEGLLAQDLGKPELVLFLLWEASHGLISPLQYLCHVLQQ